MASALVNECVNAFPLRQTAMVIFVRGGQLDYGACVFYRQGVADVYRDPTTSE